MKDGAGPLVLVIEDDAGGAFLQRQRLKRAGNRVEVATDVGGAMAILARTQVDVVVMDYRLGTTTGLDLYRRMKAAGFDLPVILVSAAMSDTIVIEAIRAGIQDVVLKDTAYLDYLSDAVGGALKQAVAIPDRMPAEKGACVLIVEDDEGVASLERRRLERAGYDVVIASTAEEAISIVGGGRVNLAVIDLRLPGEATGIDLYEELKSLGWNLPAILVTAFPDQTVAIRALRAGIRDFVPKSPDYLDYLPVAVDRVMAQARLERRLIDSEQRLASIIGTAMDAILMCDEEQRIVLFNTSAEEMFGCTASDALMQSLDRFIPGVALAVPAGTADERPRGGLRRRLEIDGVRASGERLPVEVSVSEVVIHGNRLFTVIARDISERRRIETELRDMDRRKDEFLGMLAHELRNPLAAILTAGEVLDRHGADPAAQRLTALIRRQAHALARMVDDLLDVSRVTLGKIQLAEEPLRLDQLVGCVADGVRDVMKEEGLGFEVEIDPDPVWVKGDATRLEQVLANLLNNAVKFTPPGGRIALRAAREDGEAVIRVIDNGAGIDPSLLPEVFGLFIQADTSLDRAKGGLGIGLALVRQIVSLHGGRVSATSDGPGKGSEFVVYLPAMDGEAGPSEAGSGAVSTAPADPLRVLIVDDQPDVADSMALLISALGHEAKAVYDAASALAQARSMPPDIMLVDIGMPGVTGYDLARQVRADPILSGVCLVALTGYARDEDNARAREAGFDLHLTKPLTDSRLGELLARHPGRPSGD